LDTAQENIVKTKKRLSDYNIYKTKIIDQLKYNIKQTEELIAQGRRTIKQLINAKRDLKEFEYYLNINYFKLKNTLYTQEIKFINDYSDSLDLVNIFDN